MKITNEPKVNHIHHGFTRNSRLNLHASLLPNYRGAAPINWAIINGEKETGVTTFFIEKEIDTGKIIDQESGVFSAQLR